MATKSPELSVIITAKDPDDPKLRDLKFSLGLQDFKDFETIIVTEGTSESAKAIGLKKAKGEIVCILASDNYLQDMKFFDKCLKPLREDDTIVGSFPLRYWHYNDDDVLNRYFALFGVNDPVPLYLGKNDRMPYYESEEAFGYPIIFTHDKYFTVNLPYVPTLGDNGFFIRRDILLKADIDNYYHIDVCQDLFNLGYRVYAIVDTSIHHRTGGDIIKFFKKRLKYADKFSQNRRWRMVEKKDLPRLFWFIVSTLTLVYPVYLSIRGYRRIKDKAWFLHLPICLIAIGVYGLWATQKFLSSFVASTEKKTLKTA